MNGQGQLGPLTTPSFPDPIFHFHLHKQTHITSRNIPQMPRILYQKNNLKHWTIICNNAACTGTEGTVAVAQKGEPFSESKWPHGSARLNGSGRCSEALWAMASG